MWWIFVNSDLKRSRKLQGAQINEHHDSKYAVIEVFDNEILTFLVLKYFFL